MNNIILLRLSFLALFNLMLSSCSTTFAPKNNLDNQQIMLDQLNQISRNDSTWFAKSNKAKKQINRKYQGETKPALAVYLEKDIYLYEDQKLIGYIETIANRLLNSWQGPRPSISVVIKTDPHFNASVDELNQLHISTGLLRHLENEDQLASVIAHELSHILLRHNPEKSLVDTTTLVLEWGGAIALVAGENISKKKQDKKYRDQGRNTFLGFQSLGLVWADMLSPNWSRKNESDADKLGMDLLIRANYNYEEFPNVIKKISDSGARKSERLNNFSQLANSLIQANQKLAYKAEGNQWNKALGDLTVGLIKSLKASSFKKIASSGKTHDNRSNRIDALKTYLKIAHDGGDLPPDLSVTQFRQLIGSASMKEKLDQDLLAIETINALNAKQYSTALSNAANLHYSSFQIPTSIRIAKSLVELSSREYSSAINQLSSIVRNPNAPAEAYIKLAEAHIVKQQYSSADAVLRLGIKRIGRDFRFLPSLIKANKISGNINAAENYALQCKKYDGAVNRSFSQLLVKTSKLSQQSYYLTCIKNLGYDVAEKRKSDTEKKRAETKQDYKQLKNAIKNLFKK